MSKQALMQEAIAEWYDRSYPGMPRARAFAIAEELGLDGEELHAACQADFRRGEECFADPAHNAY